MEEIDDFKRKKAIKQVREIIERVGLCMFCTKLGYVPFASRPMVTIKVDEECRLWFFSHGDSHKNAEIKHDGRVELLYEDPGHSEFLALHGTAEIMVDTEKARELWTTHAGTWFPKGPEDEDLTIIVVTPIFTHFWHEHQYKLMAMLTREQFKTAGAPNGGDEGVAVALSN